MFTFAYGFLRFLLELWRDDVERGSYGPMLDAHVYVPMCLVLMALGFVFGISVGMTATPDRGLRRCVRARDRGFCRVETGLVRGDAAVPAFDQPGRRPAQRPSRELLLRALLVTGDLKAPRLAMSIGDPAAIAALQGDEAGASRLPASSTGTEGTSTGARPGGAPYGGQPEPAEESAPDADEAAGDAESIPPKS